jgi:hypothetical protein
MGFLDRFRKKKVEKVKEKVEEMTDLEKICMDDKEAYEALYDTMLGNPSYFMQTYKISMRDAGKKAKDFEKKGDKLRARVWYRKAGGLAIYEGDVKKVKEYFGKFADLSPESNHPISKIPERAVSKAQEYYQKHLKEDS